MCCVFRLREADSVWIETAATCKEVDVEFEAPNFTDLPAGEGDGKLLSQISPSHADTDSPCSWSRRRS